MTNDTLIPAKAITEADQSDSIVVSFGAEWHQQLLSKAFSVVIRKRIPKNTSFKWLYFHINSPVSAICGRAEIKTIFTATDTEAIGLASEINLSPAEIKSYINGDHTIGCYTLGKIQLTNAPVPASKLATRLTYHPPQSFFIVSKVAKAVIDKLTGFSHQKNAIAE